MLYSSTVLRVAVPACLSFAAASLVHAAPGFPTLENRQVPDCSNLQAVRSASCWDQLNIPIYLTTWKANTPTCTTGDNGANCCEANEPWSTCFLRLATGATGSDCTAISVPGQCSDSRVTSTLSPDIVVKASYVVSTIVAIHDLFEGYAAGMSTQLLPYT